MKKVIFMFFSILCLTLPCMGEAKPDNAPHEFSFGGYKGRKFLLDGKPFQIRSAEIHPQRVPKEYWQHRIQMAKAMGLNTIAFYVFWNDIEQADGSFDFTTGNRNISDFIKLCEQEKMWVLFRPGPYACGEWDLGGLPHYLLKDPHAKFRTMHDANFMAAQERYLKAIAKEVKPFLVQNGGPILMTQLENEFGSYARKHESKYMQWLKDFWTEQGFGPFYTSDGAGDYYLKGVALPEVAVGLDPGESLTALNAAYRNNPGVPAFSSETYPGWLRHWGESNWRATDKSSKIKWFMFHKHSFNIFVFHGGTNFGFTAGANNSHKKGEEDSFLPDLTSYDYGSPCGENGLPTEEYYKYRKIIARYLKGEKLPEVPQPIKAMEINDFTPKYLAPVSSLATGKLNETYTNPPYFEQFNQNQGMAIYSTQLPAGPEAVLEYEFFHDYGHILVDGKLIKTIDRRTDFKAEKKKIIIPARNAEAVLEIYVEAMGHTNFHITMEKDRKGLYGKVIFDGKPLNNWNVKAIPLDSATITATPPAADNKYPGGLFVAEFKLEEIADTFIDMSKYIKGTVYVNGFNLGRYWNIGPQLRLYCPASVLKKGTNTIHIVELVQKEARPIRGFKTRNFDVSSVETKNSNNEW
jgi:beta-galactosidase